MPDELDNIFRINSGPQSGGVINLHKNSVIVLIGKNRVGKSMLLQSIRQKYHHDSIFLKGSYEDIESISKVNIEAALKNQIGSDRPNNVVSIIATDPDLYMIVQFFLKSLFNISLKVEENNFKIEEYQLQQDADGLKSFFNLLYYLISPHKLLLLDEPERFLHPNLRSQFLLLTSVIAKNYKKTIIIASHSREFLRFDMENVYVYLLRLKPKGLLEIRDWLSKLKVNEYTGPKHKINFFDWFYYHRDLLLSNKVILVEGVSDQIVCEALKYKFSFEIKLEDVTIKHVGKAQHEPGGRERLNKIKCFLQNLLETYCLSDKDFLNTQENISEKDLLSNRIFILKKGEIEDYYFFDEGYSFCKNLQTAKGNKIAAAYEQARLIYSKEFNEVKTQFYDLYNYFKITSEKNDEAMRILNDFAFECLDSKYIRGKKTSDHILEFTDNKTHKINFKFQENIENYEIPIAKLEQLKNEAEEIRKILNEKK